MSGGKNKKKRPKARMYSESELRRAIRESADGCVKKIILLCATAARDEFDMDEEQFVNFLARMQRYVKNEGLGLVDIEDANKSLEKHGIDLRLERW